MSLGIVLVLAACAPATSAGSDTAAVADYTLNLVPLVPLDENPLEDVDRIDLLLDSGVGEPLLVTLDAPGQGNSAVAEGLPALDGVRVVVKGYAEGELVAWGRSAPVSAVNGEVNATIFVARPEAMGQLGGLTEPDVDGAGAALGDGRFVVMGGAGNRSGGQVDKTTDQVWLLDLEAPEAGLAFSEVATLPTYVDAEGNPQTKRRGFTLTRLSAGDAGKYLLVGGGPDHAQSGSDELTAEARLFDPETFTFEEALPDQDALSSARGGHVAIANQQGGVLVWGGISPSPQAGAYFLRSDGELYDPADRSFAKVDGLEGGAAVGVAVADLGENGTLVLGGALFGETTWTLSDVSLEVSLRGDVTAIAGMDRMAGMAAVALPDGDVLVLGGVSSNSAFADAEAAPATDRVWRYRQSSESWEEVGKLEVARAGHKATLLDDTHVLVAGGATTWWPFGFAEAALSCVEVYDIENNSSVSLEGCDENDVAAGLSSRAENPILLDDPKLGVLFVGGVDGENGAVANASIYLRAASE